MSKLLCEFGENCAYPGLEDCSVRGHSLVPPKPVITHPTCCCVTCLSQLLARLEQLEAVVEEFRLRAPSTEAMHAERYQRDAETFAWSVGVDAASSITENLKRLLERVRSETFARASGIRSNEEATCLDPSCAGHKGPHVHDATGWAVAPPVDTRSSEAKAPPPSFCNSYTEQRLECVLPPDHDGPHVVHPPKESERFRIALTNAQCTNEPIAAAPDNLCTWCHKPMAGHPIMSCVGEECGLVS